MIIYKTSTLTYFLLKPQIKVPYIGMVNLVAGKKIVKEFIQKDFTPSKIRNELERLLNDSEYYTKIQQKLKTVKEKLGPSGAHRRAAKYILNFLS